MKAFLILLLAITLALKNNFSVVKNKFAIADALPGNRVYHCLVYDEDLKQTILLDGYHQENTPEFGEVWCWDGKNWKTLPGKGPLVRGGGSVAFDLRRKEIILFGGLHYLGPGEGKLLGDTWKWNGKEWKQIKGIGPQPRAWHAMAYDSYRDKTVLFGGSTGFGKTAFGDTWEWDGEKWAKIDVQGPGPHSDFDMVYDSIRRKIVLFGGQSIKADDATRKDLADTWTWDGKTWEKVSSSGPSARIQHHMIFNKATGSVILYGGNNAANEILSDMWAWNGSIWIEVKMSGETPGKRFLHAMAFDKNRNKIVLYGGGNGETILGDTWEWNGAKWIKIY